MLFFILLLQHFRRDLSAPLVVTGQIQHIPLKAVDQIGLAVLDHSGPVMAIVHMDMAVDQISGMHLLQQLPEALEATMGQIVIIAVIPNRGVGQDDIRTLVPPELEPELLPEPLLFGYIGFIYFLLTTPT